MLPLGQLTLGIRRQDPYEDEEEEGEEGLHGGGWLFVVSGPVGPKAGLSLIADSLLAGLFTAGPREIYVLRDCHSLFYLFPPH